MSVVFDAVSAVQTGSGVSSLSWTHTPVGIPTAVSVVFYGYTGGGTATCTYGGTNVPVGDMTTDATSDACYIFGLANPPSGPQTVILTFTNASYPVAASVSVTGSDTTTCFSNTAVNSGSSTAASVTCSSATGELVVDVCGQDPSGGTVTPTGSQTPFMGASGIINGGECANGSTSTGASSVTSPYSFSSSFPWAIVAASFKAGSGGGSVGSVSGTGTASGIGKSTAISVATASGAGTASGVGKSTATSVATSSGLGTATGVGASNATSVGSSSGTGIAAGVSAIAGSLATSSGIGTASGIGASTATSVASSSGSGTASGVGASTATAVAISVGQGIATAVALSTATSVGTSSGVGVASGVGSAVSNIGTAAGAGTATGVGASLISAVGTSFGVGTASGLSLANVGGGFHRDFKSPWERKDNRQTLPMPKVYHRLHDETVRKAAAAMSSLGGQARAKALTAIQRSKIATKAAVTRWK